MLRSAPDALSLGRSTRFAIFALLLAAIAPFGLRAGEAPVPTRLPAPASTLATPAAQVCPPAAPLARKFQPGESLVFKLDVFGADVGTFELWLDAPPPSAHARGGLLGHARAKISAFVAANAGRYEASATALLGRGLAPLTWQEEIEDGPTRWTSETAFPPEGGVLAAKTTRNGEAEALRLPATASARDMISAFLMLRAAPLVEGTVLCAEIFAARRMWKMSGTVGARETIDSPLGRQETVRLDLVSARLDDPSVVRMSKFWITDDARRLPIIAISEVRGKIFRAQLQPPRARK